MFHEFWSCCQQKKMNYQEKLMWVVYASTLKFKKLKVHENKLLQKKTSRLKSQFFNASLRNQPKNQNETLLKY